MLRTAFALAALLGLSSCAHPGEARLPSTLASIDVVDPGKGPASLAPLLGKVVVLEVCAAWSDACLLNARALDEVCRAACGEDVAVVSLLLDDPGRAAVESYREVLGVSQKVLLPGPRTREGASVLGPIEGIPRLVLFLRDGRIAEDVVGAVVSPQGILERVEALKK